MFYNLCVTIEFSLLFLQFCSISAKISSNFAFECIHLNYCSFYNTLLNSLIIQRLNRCEDVWPINTHFINISPTFRSYCWTWLIRKVWKGQWFGDWRPGISPIPAARSGLTLRWAWKQEGIICCISKESHLMGDLLWTMWRFMTVAVTPDLLRPSAKDSSNAQCLGCI